MNKTLCIVTSILITLGCSSVPTRTDPLESASAAYAQNPNNPAVARALCEAHVKHGTALQFLQTLSGRNDALGHYMRGLLLFSRPESTTQAITEFKLATEQDPQQPEFWGRTGLALLETEAFSDSQKYFERSIALNPKQPHLYVPYAQALHKNNLDAAAVLALKNFCTFPTSSAQIQKARSLMGQIESVQSPIPVEAQAKFDQGVAWLREADIPQQALVLFDEVLKDYPSTAAAYAMRGLAFQRVDDAVNAAESFQKAIELQPVSGRYHLYLADFYARRTRIEKAKPLYERALELNPLLDRAYEQLGNYADAAQNYELALQYFLTLTRINPDSPVAHSQLAWVYQHLDQFGPAETELQKALSLAPDRSEIKLRFGLLFAEKAKKSPNRIDRDNSARVAREWFQQVLDVDPKNTTALQAMSQLAERRDPTDKQ